MARHAEDTLRGTCIAQVLDFALAVAASEAVGAKCLVARQNGQVLDLVAAVVAAVCTVVADQRAVAEEEQIRIRVEECAAGVAAEAVNVPSVASWTKSVSSLINEGAAAGRHAGVMSQWGSSIPSSKALPSSRICLDVSGWDNCDRPALVPLRILCTDTRRRPGPAATLGRRLATPWWASAVDVLVGRGRGQRLRAGGRGGRRAAATIRGQFGI